MVISSLCVVVVNLCNSTSCRMQQKRQPCLRHSGTCMGALPKAANPDDLRKWMLEYAAQQNPEVSIKQDLDNFVAMAAGELNVSRPRLSIFSGDPPLNKGYVTYEQWLYEVKSIMVDDAHSNESLCEDIRIALKGEPKGVLMRLGPHATLEVILGKMSSVYGRMDSEEILLGSFYCVQQREDESVSGWGLRLEDILSKASQRTVMSGTRKDYMLRCVFYEGLRPALKDNSGYKFDSIRDFDQLRQAIRRIEHSRGLEPKMMLM